MVVVGLGELIFHERGFVVVVAVVRGTAALEEAQENHQVNVATAVTV